MAKLKWGILATGAIAQAFARGLAHCATGDLVAVGSRDQKKADAFGARFNVPRRHGSYEALLADPEVEAVYVSTPHPMHEEWAIKAAQAKKHVLCEKPLGLNAKQAERIITAAKEHDVFLMEAFMYRCHPQIAKLVELLRGKAIGEVRHIRAAFGFDAGFDPESRLFANHLGGGGILDVGCYPVSMSRLIAGVVAGGTIAEPLKVQAVGRLGQTGVDEWTAAVLKFPGDIVAECGTAVRLTMDNTVRIFGTDGTITIPTPWIPNREGGKTTIELLRYYGKQKGAEEITVESPNWLYALEADVVAKHIADRQAAFPAMTWEDTLGNMRTLDRWRQAIGLVYDAEK